MIKKMTVTFMAGIICLLRSAFAIVPEPVFVTSLNDDGFERFIQTADKPVIIDFWAPRCEPCMKMKPIFEQSARELKEKYLFVSVNFAEGPRIVEKYGVSSIPAFKVIKNGTVIGTFTGYTSKDIFLENIENAIHNKITLTTLFSAVQTDDKTLVAHV